MSYLESSQSSMTFADASETRHGKVALSRQWMCCWPAPRGTKAAGCAHFGPCTGCAVGKGEPARYCGISIRIGTTANRRWYCMPANEFLSVFGSSPDRHCQLTR